MNLPILQIKFVYLYVAHLNPNLTDIYETQFIQNGFQRPQYHQCIYTWSTSSYFEPSNQYILYDYRIQTG